MVRRVRARRLAALLAVAACVAIVTAACGSSSSSSAGSSGSSTSSASGSSGSSSSSGASAAKGSGTIQVGEIASLANIGGVFNAFQSGVAAFFKYENAHGGINGYKVNLTLIDDGGNPGTAAQGARTLVTGNNVVAIVGEASLADAATQKYFQAQGVPVVGGWATSSAWHKPSTNMFVSLEGPNTPYCTVWSNNTAKALHVTKIAFIAQDFPAAIQDATCREAAARYEGIAVAGKTILTSLTQADYRPAVQQAMAGGADAIYFSTGTDGQVKGIQAGQQLGFKGIYIPTQPAGLTQPLAPLGAALNGRVITDAFSALPSDVSSGNPNLVAEQAGIAQYAPQFKNEITAISGWAAGLEFADALKAVGPSKSKILTYMQGLSNYTFGGLQGPMSYTSGSRPNQCTLPLIWKDDTWVRAPNAPTTGFVCEPLLSSKGAVLVPAPSGS
jgi:branched-chain amino acid transport system substrate-binding protein